MRAQASRELLAPREDVWALLAEPYHLSDWWPGITGVQPDRRGFAAGARWQVTIAYSHPLAVRTSATSVVLVERIDPHESVTWRLLIQRLSLEVRLKATAPDRTLVTVTVEGPWRPELIGRRRTLPRAAVNRLYELCQTAATL